MLQRVQCLLFTIAIIASLCACKKTSISKYAKEGIKLELITQNNTELLKWDKVNTSDFKRYEIYASVTNDIDVVRDKLKIVATITDVDANTFDLSNLLLDTFSNTGKTFYKVAAVLGNRSAVSNTLQANSYIVYAAINEGVISTFPEVNKVLVSEFTSSISNFKVVDVLTSKVVTWPITSSFNVQFMACGKNKNGIFKFVYYDINTKEILIINTETLEIEKRIGQQYNIFAIAMLNGYILLSKYNNSSGNYVLEIMDESNATVTQSNITFNNLQTIVPAYNSNKFLCIGNDTKYYDISGSGIATLLATNSINNFTGNLPKLSPDGALILQTSGGIGLFDANLTFLKTLDPNNQSSFGAVAADIAGDRSRIAVSTQNNPTEIKLFNGFTYEPLPSIFVQSTQNSFVSFITPMFAQNQLFACTSIFSQTTGVNKLVIIKK